jgi:hypothetical protein
MGFLTFPVLAVERVGLHLVFKCFSAWDDPANNCEGRSSHPTVLVLRMIPMCKALGMTYPLCRCRMIHASRAVSERITIAALISPGPRSYVTDTVPRHVRVLPLRARIAYPLLRRGIVGQDIIKS